MRRVHDHRFATKYFVGVGVDVGSGDDPLGRYASLFPRITYVHEWDKQHGDATHLGGLAQCDFLHSSHCLEHLDDPFLALENWCKKVKFGGHLVIMVPDEDMYEQGNWPSKFNEDHKSTFTTYKRNSWSPVSIDVFNLISSVSYLAFCESIQRLTATWCQLSQVQDQTLGIGESAIEFVLRRI